MTSQAPAALDGTAAADAAVLQPPTSAQLHREASPAPTRVTAVDTAGAVVEIGGREGLDPTRYGDWEMRGRCIDF
jgi:hypothetical protein